LNRCLTSLIQDISSNITQTEVVGNECSTAVGGSRTLLENSISYVPVTIPNPCPNCVAQDITIGTQTWTKCNLDVTTYRDGTPIPQVTDPTAWVNLTTGAWCYVNNDPATGPTYGKLYNWYAVNNTANGGLAPVGYHIPTLTEWTTLTTFLGGTSVAGGKMKETGLCHWLTPNTDATNISNFTGLPAGFRNSGLFVVIGQQGYFWSSTATEYNNTEAERLVLYYDMALALHGRGLKSQGSSVRLIKEPDCLPITKINIPFFYAYSIQPSGQPQGTPIDFTSSEISACNGINTAVNVVSPNTSTIYSLSRSVQSLSVGSRVYDGLNPNPITTCSPYLTTMNGYFCTNATTKEITHVVNGIIQSITYCP